MKRMEPLEWLKFGAGHKLVSCIKPFEGRGVKNPQPSASEAVVGQPIKTLFRPPEARMKLGPSSASDPGLPLRHLV